MELVLREFNQMKSILKNMGVDVNQTPIQDTDSILI